VTGVIAGNISDEATTRVGNIFAEAMRGLPFAPTLSQNTHTFRTSGLASWYSASAS
jgi:hypothetical protein